MPTIFTLVTALILACAAEVAVAADDVYFSAAIRLETPRKKPSVIGDPSLDTVEYGIWIPATAAPVRGLIFNPFSPADRAAPPPTHWHEACRLWQFAYVVANYDGVNRTEFAATFRAALAAFAERSKHPELSDAPFCAVGMSRGGGMSRAFALEFPARAIAVAPVCLEAPPDEPPLRSIPFLTVFGEKDGGQMEKILDSHPLRRADRAAWGIAVQWGRAHEFALANNVVVPFFDAVIRRRLATSTEASEKLADYPAAEAWLGDVSAWSGKRRETTIGPAADFARDSTKAAWLPDRRTAHAWRAFVSADKNVKLVEPPGLGDGQPFAVHAPGKPIAVRVVAAAAGPAKITLYDGEIQLAEHDGPTAEFAVPLEPGIHPLYAVTRDADGNERFSRPHTLIVREE